MVQVGADLPVVPTDGKAARVLGPAVGAGGLVERLSVDVVDAADCARLLVVQPTVVGAADRHGGRLGEGAAEPAAVRARRA